MSRADISKKIWWPAAKITLFYAAVSLLWFFTIDQWLAFFVNDSEIISRLQAAKGWLFVLASSGLLFWLILRQLRSAIQKENVTRGLVEESTSDKNKLAESEERFRQLSENIDEVFWFGSPNWNEVLYVSPAYESRWGLSAEDLYKNPQTWMDAVHPDDREQVVADIPKNPNDITDSIDFREYRICRPDGQVLWIKAQAYPIRDLDGKVIRIAGIARDITEHKSAEEKIQMSEKRLAAAQHMAHIGNWELDLITDKLIWSDEIYRIFELDPEQFGASYDAFLDVIHPDDRERVDAAYTQSVTSKLPYQIEHRIRMSDGTIKYVQEHGETFYDNEGNPVCSVGTVQDITEHYLAEQTLKRLNRSLQALSACNEVLVRTNDEDELLGEVCNILVDISGYRLAWVGFVEHNDAKTIRPVAESGYDQGYLDSLELTWADTERGRGPTGCAIRTGKPSLVRNTMEDPRYELWRESAREHGYKSSVSLPLKNKDKTFGALNIYASESDAFDTKEIGLLQELADDLAYGILNLRAYEERNLLNRQLQQSQKMEAIGQLTGGIAHDFNNILASVLGFTNLALQRFVRDDQPELRDYLTEVSHAGERARDLVSQMLAFSRTDTIEAGPLPLSPMIKEVTKMLQATLPSSIQLSSQIDADVPAVMIVPVQLQQILMNMCLNARDAIGEKGHIDIQLHRVQIIKHNQRDSLTGVSRVMQQHTCSACQYEIEAGDYVELSVQDSGTGISDDVLERIFEPFFTTKDVGKGSGMGLSMVHGIVHDHGGHIIVETGLDKGTTFRLLFPIDAPELSQEPEAEVEVSPTSDGLDNARLLVVDDDESIVRFLVDLFESRGAKVTAITDSQAALDLFSKDPTAFDLMMTDQTMPKLTGAELAEKVLALRPELPVILCTGFSEQVDEAKAKELGIRGYLNKPMETKIMIKLIQSLLV